MRPSTANHEELTDTALRLSRVIEREAKRRSTHRTSTHFIAHPHATSPHLRSAKFEQFKRSMRFARDAVTGKRSASIKPLADAVSSGPATVIAPGPPVATPELAREPRWSDLVPAPLEKSNSSIDRRSLATRSGSMRQPPAVKLLPTTWKGRVWSLVDDPQSSKFAYYFSIGVFAFIMISTIAFILQTEPSLDAYNNQIGYVESLCAVVFSVEFVVRCLFCPSKRRFVSSFSNWVDFGAIFPFYLELMLNVDNAGSLGAIRIVRLTRVARVLKMSRYSSAIQVFVRAIAISIQALTMLIFLMSIAMIVFSSCIYFAEYTADGCRLDGWMGDCTNATNTVFAQSVAAAAAARAASSTDCVCVDPNPYTSIMASMWWCIVTMSTVGYGDMTPVTTPGKLVGSATVITGMLVLALPITVIGTNFQKVMKSVAQQTMKTNVDFLKGKRMLCRDEIEAILERFHAVTEGIHLDVNDIIDVYDIDNNGMLEDDELERFRYDLEMLQERALNNPHGGESMGLPSRITSVNDSVQRLERTTIAVIGTNEADVVRPVPFRSAKSAVGFPATSETTHLTPISTGAAAATRSTKSAIGISPITETTLLTPISSGSSRSGTPVSFLRDQFEHQGHHFIEHVQDHSHLQQHHSVVDDELMLLRLRELQQSWEDRLLDLEQRLEAKLNNVTKILIRMEDHMEMDS